MEKTLSLTLKPDGLKTFYPLFQQGVIIKTLVGCSIKDLLSRHLGITPEYLETRIQTLFLNGKAVDDPDKAFVRDGATLALSGAMPGLVGATLRRGGTYASLRQAITLSEEEGSVPLEEGRVTLKLFNLLVPEIAPLLAAKGFWLKGEDLDEFLKNRKGGFWADWLTIRVDGKEIDLKAVEKINWSPNKEPLLIRITLTVA
ncbi:MAG: hypothetical protein C0407_10665 [Desulfobacca sp.]|nr:hypothetical protein [Desulfobacca sp.]